MKLEVLWEDMPVATVTFIADGKTHQISQLLKGKIVRKPSTPVKEGEKFEGWYNGDTKWDFTDPVNNDMTLYAHWAKDGSKITVNSEGGDGYLSASQDLAKAGDEIWVYAEPEEGYEFVNFTSSPEVEIMHHPDGSGKFTMPDEEVTVTAHFTEAKYTVTCSPEEDVEITSTPSADLKKGDKVTLTVTPAIGYEIEDNKIQIMNDTTGEVVEIEVGDDSTVEYTMPGSNITVFAVAKPKTFEVDAKVSGKGGKIATDKNTATVGETVTVYLVPDDGYQLKSLRINKEEVTSKVSHYGSYYYYMFSGDGDVNPPYYAAVATFSKGDEPTPSVKSSSSVTSFSGVKDGDKFTFTTAVVVKEATLPGATSAKITNSSSNDGWYSFDLTADGFTGNGSMNFEVPLDVLEVKGFSTEDVGLYHKENGEWILKPTYLVSKDAKTACYKGTFDSCSPFKVDFEKGATAATSAAEIKKVDATPVTTVNADSSSTVQKTAETPVTTATTTAKATTATSIEKTATETQTTAKSPIPMMGILLGLGAAIVIRLRMRR